MPKIRVAYVLNDAAFFVSHRLPLAISVIEKGGEIIPKITSVLIRKRNPYSKKIKFIENCPSCDELLVKKNDEAKIAMLT